MGCQNMGSDLKFGAP